MNDKTLSDNERLKSDSMLLRGTISDDLDTNTSGGFSGDNFQLIRFHGMYQQDDRDIRQERTKQKLEPLHNVMLRVRLPGGIITPSQWLGIDEFATHSTEYGSIRITNRQAIQLHGVLKHNIKPIHKLLNKLGLDSRATAGDVNRNVLCTSNPVESSLHQDSYEWAKKISEHLLPKTNAYAEVWLDKEKISINDEVESILGNNYLPRKFKTAVVIPPQNDVDVHANDLSFIAISEDDKLIGFNVLVGGGLAMSYGDDSTYPRLATEFGFVSLEDTLAVAESVVSVQRDWGNRSNRRNAKTKYTLDRVGVDVFKSEVEKRSGVLFLEIKPYKFVARGDRIGWTEGVDGMNHLTLFIPSGRVVDSLEFKFKTGLLEIAKIHKGDFRLTPNQNLIVAGVAIAEKEKIELLASHYGLTGSNYSIQRKNSMACVSLPTCPLAMAEGERVLEKYVNKLEVILKRYHMQDEPIVFRITGCPNGCGRAMLAEIGLVGRAIGRYDLYMGGSVEGDRIPSLVKTNQHIDDIMLTIDSAVNMWSAERIVNESFGDFVSRTGWVNYNA